MRDWWLPMAPIAVVMYFTIFPQQFGDFLNWAGTLLH